MVGQHGCSFSPAHTAPSKVEQEVSQCYNQDCVVEHSGMRDVCELILWELPGERRDD